MLDVAATLRNLAAAVAPGGLLLLSVPNGYACQVVHREPHYGLPGLSLLPRPVAQRYCTEAGVTQHYDVGFYYPRAWYCDVLAGAGLRERDDLMNYAHARPLVDRLPGTLEMLEADARNVSCDMRLSEDLRAEVVGALETYVKHIRDSLQRRKPEDGIRAALMDSLLTARWEPLFMRK